MDGRLGNEGKKRGDGRRRVEKNRGKGMKERHTKKNKKLKKGERKE